MFYFSIDSEIKTSESAPKCRLFLWTFLQSVSYIEYMWYGRFGIVREQFVRTQSIWKRYRWNFGNRCAISVIFVSYQPHYNQKTINYLSASSLRWRLKKSVVFGGAEKGPDQSQLDNGYKVGKIPFVSCCVQNEHALPIIYLLGRISYYCEKKASPKPQESLDIIKARRKT